jgi:hypothetical protein
VTLGNLVEQQRAKPVSVVQDCRSDARPKPQVAAIA